MDDKKRAWQDARNDYKLEQAMIRRALWRLFWAASFLGLAYQFLHAEMRKGGDNGVIS